MPPRRGQKAGTVSRSRRDPKEIERLIAEAIPYDAWFKEAERRKAFLTWKEMKRLMKPGRCVELALAVDQGGDLYIDSQVPARGYFRERRASVCVQGDGSLKVRDDWDGEKYQHMETWGSTAELFWRNEQGLAVIGRRPGDRSIVWSKLGSLPPLDLRPEANVE